MSRARLVVVRWAWVAAGWLLFGVALVPILQYPPQSGRPGFLLSYLWVLPHVGAWIVVSLPLVVLSAISSREPDRRWWIAVGAVALAGAAAQPALQWLGMRALEAWGQPLLFGPLPTLEELWRFKLPAALLVMLSGTGAVAAVAARAAAAASRRNEELARAAATDAELRALQAQLRPHFLYNALHSIVALVDENPRAAKQMAVELAELLRSLLERADGATVPLGDELDRVAHYLEIETTRFEERLAIDWAVEDETRSAAVPSLLLLPLVENAITHGVAPSESGGRVRIAAERRGERLRLAVSNTLPAAPAPAAAADRAAPRPAGRGLDSTRTRLALLYPGAHRFEVERGTEHAVTVEIPWRLARGAA